MTEWTSISLTQAQKETLETAQEDAGHEGAIGKFLVSAIDTNGNTETDKDFEDYFTPDVAQTIAQHVIQDIEINSDTDTSELMDKLRRLDNRLDELPEQTAGKVQERMR